MYTLYHKTSFPDRLHWIPFTIPVDWLAIIIGSATTRMYVYLAT